MEIWGKKYPEILRISQISFDLDNYYEYDGDFFNGIFQHFSAVSVGGDSGGSKRVITAKSLLNTQFCRLNKVGFAEKPEMYHLRC